MEREPRGEQGGDAADGLVHGLSTCGRGRRSRVPAAVGDAGRSGLGSGYRGPPRGRRGSPQHQRGVRRWGGRRREGLDSSCGRVIVSWPAPRPPLQPQPPVPGAAVPPMARGGGAGRDPARVAAHRAHRLDPHVAALLGIRPRVRVAYSSSLQPRVTGARAPAGGSVLEDRHAAVLGVQLEPREALDVEHVGAVDAHETGGVEARLDLGRGSRLEVRPPRSWMADVVVLRLDVVDARRPGSRGPWRRRFTSTRSKRLSGRPGGGCRARAGRARAAALAQARPAPARSSAWPGARDRRASARSRPRAPRRRAARARRRR